MSGIKVLGTSGDYASFLSTLAYYLATAPVLEGQPDTTVAHWVLGDIGMGPIPGLPVGIIAPLNDEILFMGPGAGTGGPKGYDRDVFTVPMMVVHAEHNYEQAVAETEFPEAEGKYLEYPGYLALMELMQNVRKALRKDPTFGGCVATSRVTEIRPMLIELDNKPYRGARLTLWAEARRSRV